MSETLPESRRKRHHFKELLEASGPVLWCGAYDGISARLAEDAGFNAIFSSGFSISTRKNIPDIGILTMKDNLEACKEINNATSLPVIADVDDGFGDGPAVRNMVLKYEAAGITGVCMEDSVHPKRNSLNKQLTHRVLPVEDFVRKIQIVIETRVDPDFILIARTESFIAGQGLEDALYRAEAYANAGADLLLIHSNKPDADEVLEFTRHWSGSVPLVAVPSTYPHITARQLYDQGFKVVIFANHGIRASVSAMKSVYRTIIHTGTSAGVEEDISSFSDIFSLVKYPKEPGLEVGRDENERLK